jgi:hypothetical protein
MLANGEFFLEAHVLGKKPPGAVGYCIGRHCRLRVLVFESTAGETREGGR